MTDYQALRDAAIRDTLARHGIVPGKHLVVGRDPNDVARAIYGLDRDTFCPDPVRRGYDSSTQG